MYMKSQKKNKKKTKKKQYNERQIIKTDQRAEKNLTEI